MDPIAGSASVRRAIRVRGVVQGVGFRPAMVRLARRTGVGGVVRNDSEGVWIEIEGENAAVQAFVASLRSEAPPVARIESLEVAELEARGERDFRVVESVSAKSVRALVPADLATCDECLRELFEPADRRYRYPFINCTNCGPRFTIIADLPYDRRATTMRGFRMCRACVAEYEDPLNRRYHAEPNACPECGPQVALHDERGILARGDESIRVAADLLRRGRIVAVKGLGGYQFAVDASNAIAVGRLRERKNRPDKPLALMARDVGVLERVVVAGRRAMDGLASAARPIVVLSCKANAGVAGNVAPGLNELGVMLPATPLHHLLLRAGPPLLVMTSGNLAEEPIAIDERGLARTLGRIADAALIHDRPIHTRADDSVLREMRHALQPIRCARGVVPECISLGVDGPSILAVGAQLKNAVCVTRGSDACMSQHIGDLDNVDARAFFEETIAKLCRLLGVAPQVVAHDLHPDYASTTWAIASNLATVAVQHHHAHVAACMADNGRLAPVIGVAFDGTGCGPAGDLWGGEFLVADRTGFRRIGHLRALALPGGEAAIREPWRVALSALTDAGEPIDALRVDAGRRAAVRQLLERNVACTPTTGAGRWFDALAAMLNVRDSITYEGQAAIELEAAASSSADHRVYPFEVQNGDPFVVDLRPVVRSVSADMRARASVPDIAMRFHATLAATITDACRRGREQCGIRTVALSGGCFQNRILTELACARLDDEGFEVIVHRRVPPNDGGVALGQAAVAHRIMLERARGGKE